MKKLFYMQFLFTICYSILLVALLYFAHSLISNNYIFIPTAIVVIFLIGGLVSFIITRRVTKPVEEMIAVTSLITESVDLSTYVDYRSKNELGELSYGINRFIKGLREILLSMRDHSQLFVSESKEIEAQSRALANTSAELATAIETLSGGIFNQAERANSSSVTVKEMVEIIEDVASLTNEMDTIIQTATELVTYGQDRVNSVNDTIKHNVDNAGKLERSTEALTDVSEQANDIVQLIGNIANQTNLLALNAAIEAARSGEHGHGFSVVAEEIRNLSEETAQSVEQVQQMLNRIQTHVLECANQSQEISSLSSEQEGLAKQLDEAFQNISSSMVRVNDEMNTIKNANSQLTDGSDKIIGEMKAITNVSGEVAASGESATAQIEEQAATAEQIAKGNEKITELANELHTMANRWQGLSL